MSEQRISRVAVICDLDSGASASFAEQISGDLTLDQIMRSYAERSAALRNSLMSSVRQAQAKTGHEYKVELGNLLMPQKSMWLVAIVTRTL